MRMDQLAYFIETAQMKSINKASEKLHISHQSLNTALTNLEDELGCKLFERSYQGVSLTEAGAAIIVVAKNILEKQQHMFMIAKDHKTVPEKSANLAGQLHIYSAPFMGLAFTDMVVKDFMSVYPDVELNVKSKESWDIFNDLECDAADLNFYVTFSPSQMEQFYNHKNFTAHNLLCDKLYLVIPTRHPLYGKQKSISLSTITKYPLALYQASKNTPNPTFDLFSNSKKPEVSFVTDHLQSFIGMLELGKHCALIPHQSIINNTVFRDNKKFAFLPITNADLVYFGYLMRKTVDDHKKSLIDAFLDSLRQCF